MVKRRKAIVDAFEDVSTGLILEYKPKPVMRAAGRAVRKILVNRLRRGVEPDGTALPRGRDGGRPLRDSGELLKSFAVDVKRRRGEWDATVWAAGQRSDLGRSLRGRNAALLGVLIHGRRTENQRPRMDPMQYVPAMTPAINEAVAKEINKQLTRGKARLKTSGVGRQVRRTVDAGFAGRLLRR